MGKPGGRKKKNAGVGVDFKRVKHKVGKKLPRAQNQTDTSFKSRTISMVEQSLAADKAGQAVTGRNLTLKDLLGQCGHYSERVRRDAVQGLTELLGGHPEELRRHTTLVVEAAAARIADTDAGVRATARDLLSSTLLPALGGAALAPFVPLLMAHVCAAMTHLAEPIRADSLGFLELLMGARPDLVAADFMAPVLLHFSDQLSRGNRGRSIRAGSLASLQEVVAALEHFLAAAAAAAGGKSSCITGGGDGGGEDAEQQAPGVLLWRRCQWPPLPGAGGSPGAAPAAEGSGGPAAAGALGGADPVAAAAAAGLLGHLLECWSEAGPSQLAEAPEMVAAQCLTSILRCCDLLLGSWGVASLAGSSQEHASLATALVKAVTPHFPLYRPSAVAAPALVKQLLQLNVAAAQLLTRFLPGQQQVSSTAVPSTGRAGMLAGAAAAGARGRREPWVGRLLDWFEGVMAEGAALPEPEDSLLFGEAPQAGVSAAGGAGAAAGTEACVGKWECGEKAGGMGGASTQEEGLPGEVYQSVLDGTLAVLPLLPAPRRQQLLAAAWALWWRSSARGGARLKVLAFWRALLRNPAAAFYASTPGGGAAAAAYRGGGLAGCPASLPV